MNNERRFKKWLKTTKAKRLFSLCRWLHIYISTALFSLLVFFCFTGITLNHPSWGASSNNHVEQLTFPAILIEEIAQNEELPIKAIQQYIEQHTGLEKPRSIDVLPEFGEITYDYPLPAGYVFITVLTQDNRIEIEHKKGSLVVLMNDLHKGRHSGELWKSLIDISAILMLLFSFTGLFILLQNAKQRRQGFYVLLLGSVTPVLIYYAFVPHF